MPVRSRFAPSPTGYLHIGGARTALFAYLYARRHGGQFVLRIEDTDRERSTRESVDAILDGMRWLGLAYDEGPFFQSERTARYRDAIDQLLSTGDAYRCYCTREELDSMRAQQEADNLKARYDGRCRDRKTPRDGVDPVVRFRNPTAGAVLIDDLVQGPISIANEQLDDLIIARSDGSPTYNLTVVVDDTDMAISHVIRGDDHISNTPRQINIMRALDADLPRFAHLPMILGADGGRLSKRHGAVSVLAFREQGILPEALLNYLVRLGWSHGDQEIFSLAQMEELFDLDAVNQSAARFDQEKLLWFNQHYIQVADELVLADELAWHQDRLGIDCAAGPARPQVVRAFRERARTVVEMAESSRFLFEEFEHIDPVAAKKHLRPVVLEPLESLVTAFEQLEDWSPDVIDATINETANSHAISMGKIGQPVRVAVTGKSMSPGIGVTLTLLGKERSLARLARGLAFIRARQAGQ